MYFSVSFFFLLVLAATPKFSDATITCSTSIDIQSKISSALDSDGQPTSSLDSLRGTLDNVLTQDDCQFLLEAIPASKYVSGSGYSSQQYGEKSFPQPNISGLELKQLADPEIGFGTAAQYQRYLDIRETVRAETERALGLCPGTLRVDFTHLSLKSKGGQHTPHADNCFYTIDDNSQQIMCDPTRSHPFPNRIAASIVYINDHESFGGGEFYFANHSTAEPAVLVQPSMGRMVYFTSGIENLHGALPVKDIASDSERVCEEDNDNEDQTCPIQEPRRVYMALWYVLETEKEEFVPSYNANEEDPNAPTQVLELPVQFIRVGGLRLAFSFFLLGLQNEPSKGTWRFVQSDEVPLGMVFRDNSAMFSIGFSETALVVERHTNAGVKPSLFYQLQESMALHRVLDELDSLAFGPADDGKDVEDEDRLVVFQDPNTIEEARNKLPARAA